MNIEVKMDILFAGLLLIPVLVLAVPYIKNKLIAFAETKAISVVSLPISAFLIYDISIESNFFGLFGLSAGYIVFFFTYAVSVSLLASTAKSKNMVQ